MGLRAKWASAAEKIFNAFGDVVETVTYNSIGAQTWDGANVVRATLNVSLGMVVEKLDIEKLITRSASLDRTSLPTMHYEGVQGIIRAAELVDGTGAQVEPKVGDEVVRASGTYAVKDFYTDPANATWTLILSK